MHHTSEAKLISTRRIAWRQAIELAWQLSCSMLLDMRVIYGRDCRPCEPLSDLPAPPWHSRPAVVLCSSQPMERASRRCSGDTAPQLHAWHRLHSRVFLLLAVARASQMWLFGIRGLRAAIPPNRASSFIGSKSTTMPSLASPFPTMGEFWPLWAGMRTAACTFGILRPAVSSPRRGLALLPPRASARPVSCVTLSAGRPDCTSSLYLAGGASASML